MRLLIAFKELKSNLIRTISYIFCMILIMFVLILCISFENVILEATHQSNNDQFHNYDFILCTDDNNARYYQNDIIYNINSINDNFVEIVPLIKMQGYFKDSIITIYTCSDNDFKKIVPNIKITDKVIVSKDIADKIIQIELFNQEYEFETVISKDHFFRDGTIFIPSNIVNEISYFKNFNIKNIANFTLFKAKENINISSWKNKILAEFSDYPIEILITDCKTFGVNKEIYSNFISIMSLTLFVVSLTLIVVLYYLTKRFIYSQKQTKDVLHLLGSNKYNYLFILLIEGIILYLITILVTFFTSNYVLEILGKIIYSNYRCNLGYTNWIIISVLIFVINNIIIMICYRNTDKIKYDEKFNIKKNLYIFLIMLLLSILLRILAIYINTYLFLMLLIIALFVQFIRILIYYCSKFFKKNNPFGLYFLNTIKNSSIYFSTICIISIIFVATNLLLAADYHAYDIVENDYGVFNVDYFVTDVSDGISLQNDSYRLNKSMTTLKDVEHDIYLVNTFDFAYIFNAKTTKELPDNYVIIPIKYKYLYDYKINDKLTLEIDGIFKEYVLSGFFEVNNLHMIVAGNLTNEYNGFACKEKPIIEGDGNYQINSLKHLKQYSINGTYDKMKFIKMMCYCVILVLIIILINNYSMLFWQKKDEYEKLWLIGLSSNEFRKNFIYEFLFIALLMIISILFSPLIINVGSKYLIHSGKYFKEKQIPLFKLISFYLIALGGYVVSIIYYLINVKKIHQD